MNRSWVALAALLAGAAARVDVEPADAPLDAPFHVRVTGAAPGARLEVSATRQDAQGRRWTAVGTFAADSDGAVDVDATPSLAGSTTGLSPHGLWCAALPVPPDRLPAYVAALPKAAAPVTLPVGDPVAQPAVDVAVRVSAAGKALAETTARRRLASGPSEEVAADGLVRGRFFAAAEGAARGIPVLVLPGSNGGLPVAQAALLALHGHPALAQGLFAYKDLPAALAGLPLEHVRDGARWLEQRTGAARVAVMGTSRGAEAAALAASWFADDFAATVAYVPSAVSNAGFGPGVRDGEPAWTLAGRGVPTDFGAAGGGPADDGGPARAPPGEAGTPEFLKTWTDPAAAARAAIPVERMRGPILAIGAGADSVWPSALGATLIARRMAAHGRAADATAQIYPGAGHLLSRVGAGGPMSTFVFHPVTKSFYATGGLPNDTCEASFDAWARVLTFLAGIE